jgi:hypothetical protein
MAVSPPSSATRSSDRARSTATPIFNNAWDTAAAGVKNPLPQALLQFLPHFLTWGRIRDGVQEKYRGALASICGKRFFAGAQNDEYRAEPSSVIRSEPAKRRVSPSGGLLPAEENHRLRGKVAASRLVCRVTRIAVGEYVATAML